MQRAISSFSMICASIVEVFEYSCDGGNILFAGGDADVGLRMVNGGGGPIIFKVGAHGVCVKLQKDWHGGSAFRIEAEFFKVAEPNEGSFMFFDLFVAVVSGRFSIEEPFQ